jgi:hypothetical protein
MGLVCILAGCAKENNGGDDRAKAVDPVLKPSSGQAPAGGAATRTAAYSGAKVSKVVIVSAVPITTVLGAADGLMTARREARLRAAGKFRQFLKEKVNIEEKSESERIVKLESEKGSDLTESGKKISKFSDKYQTVSEGMVKGLQTLGYKTVSLNPKEKVYVMVCGWDAATSKAVDNLANELDKDMDKKDSQSKGTESPEERRKLDDQHAVTPAGSKFFDKPPSDKKDP